MVVHTSDDTDYETIGVDASELERYAELNLEDGELVIYDQKNEDAWVQSGAAVEVTSMA